MAIRRADWESLPIEPAPRTIPWPFGILLRSLRLSAGLSQNVLAKRAGIVAAYVCRLEQGEHAWRHPSRAVVTALARALGLDAYDTAQLLAAAGFWPWPNVPFRDVMSLLECGASVSQPASSEVA